MRYLLFISLLFGSVVVNAQHNQDEIDEKLAYQYLQNGEFEKALSYYEKFYAQKGSAYYPAYLNCLIGLEKFGKAEKLIQKEIKLNPSQLSYNVDLGLLYYQTHDTSKGNSSFEKAIKELDTNPLQIEELANTFREKKLINYTIEVYLKAKKLLKSQFNFNFDLAQAYNESRQFDLMIEEYLNLLLENKGYLQSIQNALQTNVYSENTGEKSGFLKSGLLKYIQKYPDNEVFPEMLIWVYMQEDNFKGALIQAKALDKRLNESGNRVYRLSKLALSNKQYDVAIDGFNYVIGLGKTSSLYMSGRISLVNTMKEKITESRYTQEDLFALESNYTTTIDELGKSSLTLSLLRGLANLYAFYLHKIPEAIKLLEETLGLPQLPAQEIAYCKLELADILLISGDIWEASLLYSQVEKAFSHDQLGETAKFKNAKISYYTGDFLWAKAQLDVLKGSTSKLIANDAMNLSLLITDNSTIDTNTRPLLYFARADLLFYQNKLSESLATLDTLDVAFPLHSLSDELLMMKYEIYKKEQQYDKCQDALNELLKKYGNDILGDDALFLLAELHQYILNDKEKAMELYKQLMIDYKGSSYTIEARKRFRALRGDELN